MENKKIPVEINKQYKVKIIDQENMGNGIAKIDNFAIFVDDTLPGEEAIIQITEVKKNYARGKMIELLSKSHDRVDALCDKFRICGGCDLQYQLYNAQLLFKKNKIINAMERIGKLENIKVNDIIGMDNPWSYRNKVIFHIENNRKGFYEKKSHNIVEINECNINNPLINKTYNLLKDNELDINQVMIRVGVNTNELMVVLYGKYIKDKYQPLIEKLKAIKELKTIIFNDYNKEYVLYGDGNIKEKVLNNYYKISPKSFVQVNTIQAEKLYQIIKNNIDDNDKLILDLYCGIGGIALSLSNINNKIIGIEIVEDAIKDAKENAKLNNINNVEFILGDVNKIESIFKDKKIKPDVIVLDPPRVGSDIKTINAIKEMNPNKIIYVSCEPTTLARDLNYILDNQYEIKEIIPVDMFPNTIHVETVVVMEKK
jgi:23S rRNA (uracil1939-C5)-methyltransferase